MHESDLRPVLTDMNLATGDPTEIVIDLGSARSTGIRLGTRRGRGRRSEIGIRKGIYARRVYVDAG